MQAIIQGQLMKVKKKDYEFEGKKGTSYKLDVYDGDRIESVSVSADVYSEYKDMVSESITLICSVFAKSYNLKHIEEN